MQSQNTYTDPSLPVVYSLPASLTTSASGSPFLPLGLSPRALPPRASPQALGPAEPPAAQCPLCLLQDPFQMSTSLHHLPHPCLLPFSFFFLSYKCHIRFSHSGMSDSLRPHELQHTRPPCPPSSPRVHSNSRPSSW